MCVIWRVSIFQFRALAAGLLYVALHAQFASSLLAFAGKYELSREKMEFSQYMREEGYHIIPIKPEHQLVSIKPS